MFYSSFIEDVFNFSSICWFTSLCEKDTNWLHGEHTPPSRSLTMNEVPKKQYKFINSHSIEGGWFTLNVDL